MSSEERITPELASFAETTRIACHCKTTSFQIDEAVLFLKLVTTTAIAQIRVRSACLYTGR